MRTMLGILTSSALCLCLGCSNDSAAGNGRFRLFLESEETITEGLEPGSELDNVQDGWTVRYDKLLYVAGDVRAHSNGSGATSSEKTVYLLDLKQLPESGFELLADNDAEAVRYDDVSFSNPIATSSVKSAPAVDDEDRAAMVDGGWSIYIVGQIEKSSTTVRFAWGLAAPTAYEHCGPEEGDLGFAVTRGGTTSANFTIHGDHWFFNGFPEGAEIVARQAQWVADSDLNHDGETTIDELKMTKAADVFPSSGNQKYSFAGSPEPIKTAYNFLLSQAQTIGHFQGEGECEWKSLIASTDN